MFGSGAGSGLLFAPFVVVLVVLLKTTSFKAIVQMRISIKVGKKR